MEATQVIHTNGDVENTITLNPEESTAVLERLSTDTDIVNQLLEDRPVQSTYSQLSPEEFERILDEAVGIPPQNTMENMFPEDTAPIVQGEHTERVVADNSASILEEEPVDFDDTDIPEPFDNPVPAVQESPAPIEFNQLNTNFTSDVTSRFSGAMWYSQVVNKIVTLAGCGGIGSWLGLLLARTNIGYLSLFDNDRVETGNLSGQLFSTDMIGTLKVHAVANTIREFSDYYRISNYAHRFEGYDDANDIMMCGFDNMEARKTYFQVWKAHVLEASDKSQCLLLDGRLSAECLQVYCIQGDDDSAIQYYENHCLFNDDEADATVCSYKQTSFMASMIASMMVNVFVNWCANLAGEFRPVPIFTEYDAVTMQMKIKMNAND